MNEYQTAKIFYPDCPDCRVTTGNSTVGACMGHSLNQAQPVSSVTLVPNVTIAPLPPSIFTYNKTVATEPFRQKGVETKMVKGLATIAQKHVLTPLKVLFGSAKYGEVQTGWTVYVPAAYYAKEWAKQVYDLDDRQFILVPESEIVLVRAS